MAVQARDLMAGGVDIAPWIARQLLDFFESQLTEVAMPLARTRVESITNPLELTPTERQLLRHLSVGERLAQAAQRVGLAPADCTARVRSIHRRMQWSLRAGDLTLN
jgi:DNA-binding NarL/FixJ family response regulator